MGSVVEQVASLLGSSPETMADPGPAWHALGEAGPVVDIEAVLWVTAYDEVREILRCGLPFSSDSRRRGSRTDQLRSVMTEAQREAFDEMSHFHSLFVQGSDGEAHNR